jgi:excisionase family DNA binding protein
MVSFDIKEAAAFLKVHPETLRQMAKDGTVSGAKIGRRWVFIQEHLVNHITQQYSTSGGLRLVVDNTNGGIKKWQFTNEKTTKAIVITSTSPRQTAREYDVLLARPTSNKRKNCTTK